MWMRRASAGDNPRRKRSEGTSPPVWGSAAVCAVAVVQLLMNNSDLQAWQMLLIGGSVFLLLAIAAYGLRRSVARDRDQVREGRARVRAAEVDFVEALRGTRPRIEVVMPGPRPDGPSVEESQERDAASEQKPLQPRPGERLALPELWEVTHSRLDLYHDIALGQARRSFRNAQMAMVLGFGLLVVFVLVALRASTTAGAIVAGGLGAVSAGLAGYVSRTFVKSQETAASHLRAYFEQPLEFSRFLAAERIARDSGLDDDQRAEVLASLVTAMVTGPVAPPSGAGEPPAGSAPRTGQV